MKRLRKLITIVFAMVMGFGTMMPAFADPNGSDTDGNISVDQKITVNGLEAGDVVKAYKFISWVQNTGWELADGITDIELDQITGGLTVDELATLATQTDKMTLVVSDGKPTDGTWEMTCGTVDTAGSYLILVTSGDDVKYVYNPAVVSADFDGTNASAVNLTADAAMIKKQEVTVEKEFDDPNDAAVQIGDIVPFTVTVTVPQYNDNWTEPYFAVSDVLSTGLTISTVPSIEGLTKGTDYIITEGGTEGASGFTIQFTESYLKENISASIEIKYSALVGEDVAIDDQVNEETNTVTLEFSHDPSDSEDHNTIEDETYHYTFAIDGKRLGTGTEKTNELIKVGIDEDGNEITEIREGDLTETDASPLAGAEFTLTGVGPEGTGKTVLTAISDEDGHIFFNNLDTGKYELKETKAPNGYIKDPDTYEVVIYAEYYADGTLNYYTITIDGKSTSTYTATTTAEETKVYTTPADGNPSFPVINVIGTELPSTGGIGTTIFYIVGGGMVAGAVVFLLTKRRVAGNE